MAWPPRTHQDVQDAVEVLRESAANVKNYGARGDGEQDDTDAFVRALASTSGRTLFLPHGTYRIPSSTRLRMTADFSTIVGDPSGRSTLRFEAPAGGLDIGTAGRITYAPRLRDLILTGNDSARTLLRLRGVHEPSFPGLWLSNAADTLVEAVDSSEIDADRLKLSHAPTGISIRGSTASVITLRTANFFSLGEVVRVSSDSLGRFLLSESWIEACTDVVSLHNPGKPIALGELVLDRCRFFTSGETFRLLHAIDAGAVNSDMVDVSHCYIDAAKSTTPLVDFTGYNNANGTFRLSMSRCRVSTAVAGAIIQVHPLQPWPLFHIDVDRISGVPSDRWAPPYGIGASPRPYVLSGAGSPEGAVAAPIGSLFQRSDGGTGNSLYVKESGTGTTGWVAK